MDSITIVLDTDDAGLILEWLSRCIHYIPEEYETLQLDSMTKLEKQIQRELDSIALEPDHDFNHF